jgi:hypothetical protein
VGKVKIDLWDCNSSVPAINMKDFIVNSRDYPEGMLGMLGMLLDEKEVGKVLVPGATSPDVIYNGRGYTFDLTKASESGTAFSLDDQFQGRAPRTRGPEVVKNTILFRGLSSLFDFDYTNGARPGATAARFLPSLNDQRLALEKNFYLDDVIPAQVDLAGGDFQDIRGGLISCLLGGGDCGFNNVKMAEAAARLATGRRVFARLEDIADEESPAMPAPLNSVEWRNSNIIDPMQLVGEEGTAKVMKGMVKLPAQYRAIYKTGTISEGVGGRESEALMFVVGKWNRQSFVEGESVAGFLYMEKSKTHDESAIDGGMKKFRLAAPIINAIIQYLAEMEKTRMAKAPVRH